MVASPTNSSECVRTAMVDFVRFRLHEQETAQLHGQELRARGGRVRLAAVPQTRQVHRHDGTCATKPCVDRGRNTTTTNTTTITSTRVSCALYIHLIHFSYYCNLYFSFCRFLWWRVKSRRRSVIPDGYRCVCDETRTGKNCEQSVNYCDEHGVPQVCRPALSDTHASNPEGNRNRIFQ